MSHDKPTKEERHASAQPGCRCEQCALRHSDQGLTAEELLIDQLQQKVAKLEARPKTSQELVIDELRAEVVRLKAESSSYLRIATDNGALQQAAMRECERLRSQNGGLVYEAEARGGEARRRAVIAEREACARLADAKTVGAEELWDSGTTMRVAREIAAGIRARGAA